MTKSLVTDLVIAYYCYTNTNSTNHKSPYHLQPFTSTLQPVMKQKTLTWISAARMPSFRFPQISIKKSEKYEAISNDSDNVSEYSGESDVPLAPTRSHLVKRHRNFMLYATIIVFGALATFFFATTMSFRRRGTFHNGFDNELGYYSPVPLV